MLRRPAWTLVPLALVGCRASHPSQLPTQPGWLVAVKSCRLNGSSAWYKGLAHHAWIDLKRGDESRWLRIESGGRLLGVRFDDLDPEEARLDTRFGGNTVRLLGWVDGAAARRVAEALEARAHELEDVYADSYRMWPGPNSNSFIYEVAAAAPELGFVFDPNCIGKDWSGWVDAGLTASKTGVRIDTVPIGAAVGLREGVEVHLFGMTLGVSLDPPGLSLPLLPQIPWGLLPGADPSLRAPVIEGALRQVVDQRVLQGDRVILGTIGQPFVMVFECADGSGWLRIDGKLGARVTARSREFNLEVRNHDREGVTVTGLGTLLDSSAPPEPRSVRCGDALGQLQFTELPDDRVQVAATWHHPQGEVRPMAR